MNHFGKAPLIFGLLFLLAFPVVVFRGDDQTSTLEFWVFHQIHYDEYAARIPAFEAANPGVKVELRQVSKSHDKLLAAFLSGIGAPDLAEVEISSVGRFFKGSKEEIGFVDVTDRIEADGIMDEFVRARMAPWSLDGRVYGLPHDVHPVVLLYRHDAYEEAGIAPESIETWDDFVRETRPLARDDDGDGRPDRYPLLLSAHKPGHFWLLLLQNGGGMFDEHGGVIIDNEIAVSTLEYYCRLLNEERLAIPEFSQDPANFAAMKEGVVLGILAPDWYIGSVRRFVPELAGKWRAMPLPAWREGERRTSTWGGTMIAITNQAENPDLAWEFVKYAYMDDEALANRYRKTYIIPPIRSAWSNPVFSEPDPYLGGQVLGRKLTDLAPDIPGFYLNPYWAEANDLLRQAVYEAANGIRTPADALSNLAEQVRALMRETTAANTDGEMKSTAANTDGQTKSTAATEGE